MKKKQIIGKKFGKLLVLREADYKKNKKVLWECLCECGRKTIVQGDNLKSENTKSCGCLSRTHKKSKTKTYRVWTSMLDRCNNPKSQAYKDYGGRGISVCERWHKFGKFLFDMGEKPDGYSIERTNNDGNYYPENCQWIPKGQQQHNKRARGYYWCKRRKRWGAYIMRNKKTYFLGRFTSEDEAAQAYKNAKEALQ